MQHPTKSLEYWCHLDIKQLQSSGGSGGQIVTLQVPHDTLHVVHVGECRMTGHQKNDLTTAASGCSNGQIVALPGTSSHSSCTPPSGTIQVAGNFQLGQQSETVLSTKLLLPTTQSVCFGLLSVCGASVYTFYSPTRLPDIWPVEMVLEAKYRATAGIGPLAKIANKLKCGW